MERERERERDRETETELMLLLPFSRRQNDDRKQQLTSFVPFSALSLLSKKNQNSQQPAS